MIKYLLVMILQSGQSIEQINMKLPDQATCEAVRKDILRQKNGNFYVTSQGCYPVPVPEVWILDVVVGGNTSQSGFTTITHEHTSKERCEAARVDIIKQFKPRNQTPMPIHGCYLK